MLNVMRDNLRHLKWVLWLVAIAMTLSLGYYFVDRPGSSGADWAALVNDTPVSSREFINELRKRDDYYRQLFREQYETFRPQLTQQVLRELIDREIMLQEADRLGLAASPEEISRAILEDPSLKGPDGAFIGRDQYVQFLERAYPGGAAAYEQLLADEITIAHWQTLVTSPAQVSEADVRDLFRKRFDKTEVDFVVVSLQEYADKISQRVSDDELRRWYEKERDRYMRGEARQIRYILVERQAQLESIQVEDSEVQAFYRDRIDQFSRPEQRRARHILVRVDPGAAEPERAEARARAEGLLARLQSGESFETLAEEHSDDPGSAARGGDLGFFGRGAMVAEFDQAAFATPVGEFAPVVESQFGFHVIQVLEERPPGTIPLAEVQDTIRRQIRQQLADEAVRSEARRLLGQISTASDFDTVAAADGYAVQERLVAADDRLSDLGPSPAFMTAVSSMDPGSVSEPLDVRQGQALVVVTDIVPPSVKPFEEVEVTAKAHLLNDRALRAARDAAKAAFDRHGTLEDAASALGLTPSPSGELTPGSSLPGAGGTSPELRESLFGPLTQTGDVGLSPVPAGMVIYEVTRREGLDEARFTELETGLRNELLQLRQGELLQSVIDKISKDYEIQINTELVSRVGA